MTWIVKNYKNNSETHYYVGFSSICRSGDIITPKALSYSIEISNDVPYCKCCQTILKSKKIHQKIVQRENNLELVQKKIGKFGVTLQGMVLNNISSHDSRAAKISELKKLFNEYFPQIYLEDILILLLIFGKIKISEDTITLCFVEATHVR